VTHPKTQLRRSWLYVPASKQEWYPSLSNSDADVLILDLEDGVPDDYKSRAREILSNEVKTNFTFREKEFFVRINGIDSGDFLPDVKTSLGLLPHLCGILLPKVRNAQDVLKLEAMIKDTPLEIVPTIETLEGENNAKEIMNATGRIHAVQWGENGDYSLDFGRFHPRLDAMTDPVALHFAVTIIKEAKRSKKMLLDGLSLVVNDSAGLDRRCEWAVSMGFDGKGALHPSQVGPINRAFTLSAEALEEAREIVKIYEETHQCNSFVSYKGGYITPPRYKSAKALLTKK
jgi:citrate lyase subunit beta/citryl-CoA lyase